MKDVNERPEGAKFHAVCWEDASDRQRWLSALEEQTSDLLAVARDRVREKRRRVLSRHEAARTVRATGRAIGQLLEAAKAGLRPSEPPPPLEPLPSPPSDVAEGEAPSSARRVVQRPPGSEGA